MNSQMASTFIDNNARVIASAVVGQSSTGIGSKVRGLVNLP